MKFLKYYLIALCYALYSFTFGVFSKRTRKLVYDISRYFGFSTKLKPRLHPRKLEEVIPATVEVTLTHTAISDGNVSVYELVVLCSLVKHFKPGSIFEIGTFDGRTTINMKLNAPDNALVHTLDLPESGLGNTAFNLEAYEKIYVKKHASGSRFKAHPQSGSIQQLYGDSGSFDFAPYMNTTDFVFIDGSHAYDYVCADTENAFRLLRNGKGVLVWHDYGVWDGVTRFIDERSRSDKRFANVVYISDSSVVFLVVE